MFFSALKMREFFQVKEKRVMLKITKGHEDLSYLCINVNSNYSIITISIISET